jgi:hypothetical protein
MLADAASAMVRPGDSGGGMKMMTSLSGCGYNRGTRRIAQRSYKSLAVFGPGGHVLFPGFPRGI